jgi:oligopeptide transport system substrate-binding protein
MTWIMVQLSEMTGKTMRNWAYGRNWVYGLGAICIALFLAVGQIAAAQAAGNTLIRGIGDNWETLDPQLVQSTKDSIIEGDLYEGLVGVDVAGTPIPGAAESWDISADGLTYTFHLRPNLKWSNGDPLVAQDFVNGMRRVIEPETASYKAYYLSLQLPIVGAADYNGGSGDFSAVGIKAPDDRTVVINLTALCPQALILLNFYTSAPLHTPSWQAFGKDFVNPGNAVTNGAYVTKEVVQQSHVLAVKNPNYWDAANVKIDAVKFLVTSDITTELRQYEAGEVDVTYEVPEDALARMKKERPAELHLSPIARGNFISFNQNKAPLTDIRIREALALAIDRVTLQERILKVGDIPIMSHVPQVIPNYPHLKPTTMTGDYAQDAARAQQLMAEAGYGVGKPLTLDFYCFADEVSKRQAQAVGIMWQQKLGVVSRYTFQETQAHYDTFYNYEWDAYCDSSGGDYVGAESFLIYRAKAAEAGYNWDSPKYEELMAQVAQQSDMGKRNELLAQAEQVLLDDYIMAPLSNVVRRELITPRLKGWVDNPIEYHLTKYLTLQ